MSMTVPNSSLAIARSNAMVDDIAFSIANYLSQDQQEVYNKYIDSLLKNHIGNSLLASEDAQDLATARLILDIVRTYREAGKNIGELFFMGLLTNPPDEVNKSLTKLLEIVNCELGEVFFKCVTTQKNEYYDVQTLVAIIDAFHKMIPHVPKPCPVYSHFLSYDQGGKEALAELIKNPNNLKSLIKSNPVASNLQPDRPPTLKDLTTKTRDFKQIKEGATRYLASLNEQHRLKLEVYLELFRELQDGSQNRVFNPLEKRAIVVLILLTTTDEQAPISTKYTQADLRELITEARIVHERCGEEVLIEFCNAPHLLEKAYLDDIIRTLRHLYHCYQDFSKLDMLQNLMTAFSGGKLSLAGLLKSLEELNPQPMEDAFQDKESLDSLYNRFAGSSNDPNVVYPLPAAILAKIKTQYASVQRYCKEWDQLRIGELVNKASAISLKGKDTPLSIDDTLQLVAIGRLAMRIKFKMYLYNTQVCTVLAEMMFPDGAIAQVKTGEGKSMIVALLAFVLALQHRTQGHIISSSRGLSVRDQRHYADFFLTFGLTSSHICEDNRDASHFQSQILYGTATDFEFAVMREMLYLRKLFPQKAMDFQGKRFDWVVVDEMDLTIDTARSGARLSSQAEITHDWVYTPIFRFIQTHCDVNSSSLKFGFLLNQLKDYLRKYMDGRFASAADELSDKKLLNWMASAHRANFILVEKVDYIIGLRNTRGGDKTKGILIVDVENTGRIMVGSRWSNGVHEFVEAKHNLEIERENISPISMSNPVFYQMYRHLCGITGTIGSNFEREELKAIYNITSFDVPTHNPPQRKDLPTIIFETTAKYLDETIKIIRDHVAQGRPILVLCETINDSETMAKLLTGINVPFEMLNGNQENEEHEEEVIGKAGRPGAVTIATNIAGRGTDIKLTPESLAKGGLHVLITFDPDSDRVDLQARGRAGRQGQRGTSQIFLSKEILVKHNSEFLQMDQARILEQLKQQRQQKAILQKDTHISYANIERFCFKMVIRFYELLNRLEELSLQDSFLNKLAAYFNNLKLGTPPKINLDGLSPKNRLVAQEALKLLTTYSDCTMHWKVIVKQLAERVRNAMINDFALNFYLRVNDAIQASGVTSYSEKMTQFKQLLESLFKNIADHALQNTFQQLDKVVKEGSEKALEGVRKDLTHLFDQRLDFWTKYLDPSGHGLISYLSEMTQVELTPVDSNTQIGKAMDTAKKVRTALRFDVDFQSGENSHTKKAKRTSHTPFTDSDEDLARFAAGVLEGIFDQGSASERDSKHSVDSASVFSQWKIDSWLDNCDVVIPPFTARSQLPAPPQGGIRIGLKNYGNTCWLNSLLKFISCTTYYDRMLTDPPPAGKERFQGILREVVVALRLGKEPGNFLNALLKEISDLIPTLHIGTQQDAPELLFKLIDQLKWKPANAAKGAETEAFNKEGTYPRLGLTYKPQGNAPQGWGRYGTVENFQTHVDITIPKHFSGKELDLLTLLYDEGIRELKPEKLLATAQGDIKTMKFLSKTYLLHLPKIIMINIKRVSVVQADNKERSESIQQRIGAPIKLDKNQLIPLLRHDVVYETIAGVKRAVAIQPAEIKFYRIGAAVVQTGNVDSGHYRCMERAADGTLIKHDDTSCETNTKEDLSTLGYFVRLDLVP